MLMFIQIQICIDVDVYIPNHIFIYSYTRNDIGGWSYEFDCG
jgi:hypothetical protein